MPVRMARPRTSAAHFEIPIPIPTVYHFPQSTCFTMWSLQESTMASHPWPLCKCPGGPDQLLTPRALLFISPIMSTVARRSILLFTLKSPKKAYHSQWPPVVQQTLDSQRSIQTTPTQIHLKYRPSASPVKRWPAIPTCHLLSGPALHHQQSPMSLKQPLQVPLHPPARKPIPAPSNAQRHWCTAKAIFVTAPP